ncbi:MAG: Ig-like domain-containing protein, partial [Hydrotalea flava]|nr:Ig-like domain-containing protein [Hydrotalea flava]
MKSTTRIMLWVFATLGGFTQVQSQTSGLCNSAALKPVFIQDFGTASSPTATSEAAPGSTSYIYGNVGTDGHYIITPLVQNAHKSDWAIGGDHTGNTNGNMFLVNAGGNNSIYFRDTVSNLCDGSVFNFSAWLANVNSPNTQTVCGSGLVYARVIFNVKDLNGNILGTITTGNLPLSPTAGPLNWNQYGFQFALPAGMNTLVLEMVDYYGGGAQCGNDLALDDILFTACTPNVTANITTANSVCVGSTANIVASLVNNPFTAPAYQWQKSTDNGTTWNNIGVPVNTNSLTINNVQLSDSGLYRVLVGPNAASLNSASCITASNSIQLSVHPIPIVSVQSNSPLCAGGTLFLSSTVNGNNNFVNNSKKNNNDNDDNDKSKNNHSNTYSYQWNGPNGFTSTLANPSIANVTTAASGSYLLTLTDNYGCSNTAQTSVTVNPLPVIAPITGDSGTCAGSTVQLTTTTKGGVWSSSNTSVATIDTTGKVTAISAGTTTITYTMTNQYGCSVSVGKSFTVNSVQMLPAVATCNNGTIKFSNTPYMPTYGSSSGIYLWTVTGGGTNYVAGTSNTSRYPQIKFDDNSIDTVTVAYTVNGITCSSTQIIYIRSTMPISGGADTLCAGTTATFVNPVPGGTWSSSNTGVATVSQAGIVTAIAAGTTTLSYTNACGQTVTRNILVQAKPIVNPIQASANAVCMGNTLTVNTTSVGGVWMSSNTQVATIDSITGAVTILQPGTTTITYTLQNKCGIASQSITITVNPLPTVQPINTGSGQVCAGSSVTVTDATPGGVWSSSNTSVATIDNSGKITAIAAGTTTITYTVTNGSGCTTSVSAPITVNPLPTVQPINTGSGQVCAGSSVTVTDA